MSPAVTARAASGTVRRGCCGSRPCSTPIRTGISAQSTSRTRSGLQAHRLPRPRRDGDGCRAAHLAGEGQMGTRGGRLPAAPGAHVARGDDLLPGLPGAREGDRRARLGAAVGVREAGRDPAPGARGASPRDRRRIRLARPGTSASRASCACSPRPGPSDGWSRSSYGPGVYVPAKPRAGPGSGRYAIEPSATPVRSTSSAWTRAGRPRRTFKVERILEASLTPETFEGSSTTIARELLAAWDVISDEPMVRVGVRFSPEVAARVAETSWHPGPGPEPQPGRIAHLDARGLGRAGGAHLDPGLGRRCRGPGAGRAAGARSRPSWPGQLPLPLTG